jgi:hypothetical protein
VKMTDMRRTKSEQAALKKRYEAPLIGGDDEYHHGLRVSLDHDSMNKVGMRETPKPGDEFHIQAHGRVVSASDASREGQKSPDRRVEIVLHRMGAEPKSKADDGKSLKEELNEVTAKSASA